PTAAFSTLSLHDALPIFLRNGAQGSRNALRLGNQTEERNERGDCERTGSGHDESSRLVRGRRARIGGRRGASAGDSGVQQTDAGDRKSTRLNSSHVSISY